MILIFKAGELYLADLGGEDFSSYCVNLAREYKVFDSRRPGGNVSVN